MKNISITKRYSIVSITCMLLGSLPASAAIIAADSFNDYSLGALDTQNSGSGWSSAWSTASTFGTTSEVTAGGLSYSSGDININGGSMALTVIPNNNHDPLLNRGFTSSSDTDVWFSLLLNQSVKGVSSSTFWDYFAFQVGNGGDNANEGAIGQLNNNGSVFGARATLSGNNRATTDSSATINIGTTYLLVGRLSKSDTNYDSISLWVNPDSITDPGAANATAVYDIGINTVTNFSMRSFLFSPPTDNPSEFIIDEVRIGTDYGSVVAVPEPSVYASVLGLLGLVLVFIRRRKLRS